MASIAKIFVFFEDQYPELAQMLCPLTGLHFLEQSGSVTMVCGVKDTQARNAGFATLGFLMMEGLPNVPGGVSSSVTSG